MKTLARFIVLLLVALPTFIFAQYPTDEKISPWPRTVKQRTLVQRFDANADEVGKWKALHDCKLSATKTSIIVESTSHDPYLLLPPIEKPVSGDFEFRIEMKNDMAPQAQVFWGTTTNAGFQEDRAMHFRFAKEERPSVSSFTFESTEPVTRLRLDPGNSTGKAEIQWIELYKVDYAENEPKRNEWYDHSWAEKVKNWKTVSAGTLQVRFDENGTGAFVFQDEKIVGEISPLAYVNTELPLGGELPNSGAPVISKPLDLKTLKSDENSMEYSVALDSKQLGILRFSISEHAASASAPQEIRFELKKTEGTDTPSFGPVFRPVGELRYGLLCGVEYLEKGEHSSSTADNETPAHLRFAPKSWDVTWPFMAIVTEKTAFGLLWDDPETQCVFATPDFVFDKPESHYLGLHGTEYAGTLRIAKPQNEADTEESCAKLNDLERLILWAIGKWGLPELPPRPRDDEAQRLLSLAGFEKSVIYEPGQGWRHASGPNVQSVPFKPIFGSDFITAIWQLSGKLPETPRVEHGQAHLRNPGCYFLLGQAERLVDIYRDDARSARAAQRPDGSFPYRGKYLRGHWEDTASGFCGNALNRLMYDYRFLGEPEILEAAKKGLDFANRFAVPRGAQVWELSLHTPDIMGSSRMCISNVWCYEATGEKKYLDAAVRWAVTGLPFVYFWEPKNSIKNSVRAEGVNEFVMKYATTPVFGATDWKAPNWIGLPVQWCGLDYSEALFLLAEHDKTVDWKKIAEGILIVAEQMQYPSGPSIGLLPDSFVPERQTRHIWDINPTVMVMQRQRLQGKLDSIDIIRSEDGTIRVVSPFKTRFEKDADGKTVIVVEAVSGTKYQILVNDKAIDVESKGVDRIAVEQAAGQ